MRVENNTLCISAGIPVDQHPTTHHEGRFASGKPAYIILHYTATATAREAIILFSNGIQPRTSAHLVIDHDGTITQMVPLDTIAWHAGLSHWQGVDNLNHCSIGIEIANFGWLTGTRGSWKSWNGTPVLDDRVIETPGHPHAMAWERFDPAQMEAAFNVTRAVMTAYGIPAGHVLGHEDIAPRRKQDPGPAFDMDRFRNSLAMA